MICFFFLLQAIATRDALAKALYGTLFDWIVLQVNHTLAMKQSTVIEVHVLQLGLAIDHRFNFYIHCVAGILKHLFSNIYSHRTRLHLKYTQM